MRCATIGCTAAPVATLVWSESDYSPEPVCGECADSYSRRPGVTAAATIAADCRHCGRSIANDRGTWVDPEATGDDSVWRETCDAHDTFTAEHEPVSA